MFFKSGMFYFTKMLEFFSLPMSTHSKLVLYSLKHFLAFFFSLFVAKNQYFFSIKKKYIQNSPKR